MRIRKKDLVLNLNNYDRVSYIGGILNPDSYVIYATKKSNGFFGGSESDDIIRVYGEEYARKLLKAITDAWMQDESWFDLDKWLEENQNTFLGED